MPRVLHEKEKRIRVSYRFPPDMLSDLEKYAAEQERSVTAQIIMFIKQGLADAGKGKK